MLGPGPVGVEVGCAWYPGQPVNLGANGSATLAADG